MATRTGLRGFDVESTRWLSMREIKAIARNYGVPVDDLVDRAWHDGLALRGAYAGNVKAKLQQHGKV